ncbi:MULTISPECIES: ATP-grasp domain-containing protein [Pseudomonas]|uniref:ATP-grasp domain-containing protein n=1 Tax=Pseudomonas auratipiscis TaxID=3115853 RepID=A0AB35WS04_9PSED|nr:MULTISPECIES: ATP-grasp domain-containing protein [unclassified Pseudomonas]MEE1866004.1 ATP-grasp domain-containing protein [Pseudomonas sp. 120P]MEE1956827.1 ATP-grasp domain-containing protein [Pseudomonas sp. 119P]
MHIVIVNRWPRFVDSERWDNELTQYEHFFDHHLHRISYVVDGPGAEGVLTPREDIAHLVQVQDVNQYEQLLAAVSEIVAKVGPVDLLIALSEFTLEIAARVRQTLNIPGHGPAQVAVYRDKARMKEILQDHGLAVPTFTRCQSLEQTLAFAAEIGYPVIVKPVDGAASIGVGKATDEPSLIALLSGVELQRYEVEAFIQGQVYHIDGFTDEQGCVPFQVVSRYINSCLDFASNQPLGSVIVQDSPLRTRIESFSQRCLQALDLHSSAFHLEIFVNDDGELVFLEVGGRVGGSEVPHLINEIFGVNLYEHWLKRLIGLPPQVVANAQDPSGGWLIIPKPAQLPCRVINAQGPEVPSLWRSLLPAPGEVLEAGGGYDALHSGRFIFTGANETDIERDIQHVITHFQFQAEPL